MRERTVSQIIRSQEVTEGGGVQVFRSIGTPARRNLDPFLMLDQFSTDNPDDYIAGFPEHPHRGFSTFTYMLDGHMRHGDSMGNQGDLGPGGAQWMKAASGVIHSEMPMQENGRMRGFQLWINLPAADKMSDPDYQEVSAKAIPEHVESDQCVRVLAGDYAEMHGPVSDPHTKVQYLDVQLHAGADFEHDIEAGRAAFLYVYEGSLHLGDVEVRAQELAVLDHGDHVTLTAGAQESRFLLVSGRPIGEPIVQYGPFVMNTREEIEQAMRDYRDGRLVQRKAEMHALS